MENTTHKLAHVENVYDEQLSLLISRWFTFAETKDEDFKKLIIDYFEVVKTCKPKLILINSKDARYVIGAETQSWIVSDFHPLYAEIGLKKWAIILSEDFLMALSMEQSVDEDKNAVMQIQYFDNEKAALEWLV